MNKIALAIALALATTTAGATKKPSSSSANAGAIAGAAAGVIVHNTNNVNKNWNKNTQNSHNRTLDSTSSVNVGDTQVQNNPTINVTVDVPQAPTTRIERAPAGTSLAAGDVAVEGDSVDAQNSVVVQGSTYEAADLSEAAPPIAAPDIQPTVKCAHVVTGGLSLGGLGAGLVGGGTYIDEDCVDSELMRLALQAGDEDNRRAANDFMKAKLADRRQKYEARELSKKAREEDVSPHSHGVFDTID